MHITLMITYPRNELYDYVSSMQIICMYIITIVYTLNMEILLNGT